MVWEGLSPADAALQLGYRGWVKHITRPDVQAYIKQQTDVFRVAERPRTFHRFKQIRDAADNMPAVNAGKALIGEDDSSQRLNAVTHSPGVTIKVINVVAPSSDILDQNATNVTPQRLSHDHD